MSERRPLRAHRESNHYVFPLSSCLCVWSKHNVMAKGAAANHRALVSLAANPLEHIAGVGVPGRAYRRVCEPDRPIVLCSWLLRYILVNTYYNTRKLLDASHVRQFNISQNIFGYLFINVSPPPPRSYFSRRMQNLRLPPAPCVISVLFH